MQLKTPWLGEEGGGAHDTAFDVLSRWMHAPTALRCCVV